MGYTGELISLAVAISWTATALFAEVGTKRIGSLQLNIIRMTLSLLMLGATLWIVTGAPWPRFADGQTWFWLLLSGLIGYVFGDLVPLQLLSGNRCAFRAALYDSGSSGGSYNGLGVTWRDNFLERSVGYGCDSFGHRYVHSKQGSWTQSGRQASYKRSFAGYRCGSWARSWARTKQGRYGTLSCCNP